MSNDGKIAGQPYLSTDWGEYETAHLTLQRRRAARCEAWRSTKSLVGRRVRLMRANTKLLLRRKNGYTWFDGTNEPIEFTYDIERAPITFRLSLMGGNGSSIMGVPYDFDAASLSYALKAFTSDGEEVTNYSGNWPVVTESSKIKRGNSVPIIGFMPTTQTFLPNPVTIRFRKRAAHRGGLGLFVLAFLLMMNQITIRFNSPTMGRGMPRSFLRTASIPSRRIT